MTCFGYPILPRAGLGNMLFPWADCLLWCRDQDVPMIDPTWRKARIGPYLRGERDRRAYQRLFLPGTAVTGLRKWLLLLGMKRTRFRPGLTASQAEGSIVTFRDLSGFPRLAGRHDEVLEELCRITRPELVPPQPTEPFIGLHVRLGDYVTPDAARSRPDSHVRLEISWYMAALRELRAELGGMVPAVLFSDGSDGELRLLLAEEKVTRSPYREAVTDLLALSGAGVMVASCSTFSLWGSFLGQVPAVWHPETRFRSAVTAAEPYLLEPEWTSGRHLPQSFVETVRSRFSR